MDENVINPPVDKPIIDSRFIKMDISKFKKKDMSRVPFDRTKMKNGTESMTFRRMTPEGWETATKIIEDSLKIDAPIATAVERAEITRGQFDKRMKNNKDFERRIKHASTWLKLMARQVVVREIMENKNGEFALKWLKLRDRDEYYEKNKSEVSGINGGAIDSSVNITFISAPSNIPAIEEVDNIIEI